MSPKVSLWLPVASLLAGCGGSIGTDGSELDVPYDNLRGGLIFATRAISGSAGYDLFWIPIPDPGTMTVVPFVQLTDSDANETQPAISKNGRGMAFASDDGIFAISGPEGRIHRVSDTSGTSFADSLPAVSPNADRVAWVRTDTSKPIEGTVFYESFIMIADFDAANPRAVNPKPGILQDAPAFDPNEDPRTTRIAWSEFAPGSIQSGFGPTEYGIMVFDYGLNTGTFACKSSAGVTPGTAALPQRGWGYRCFGQHLVWPRLDTLVLGQDLLEINLTTGTLATIWTDAMKSIQTQQLGVPDISSRGDGFFPAFPISASYDSAVTRMVVDGVVASMQGDLPTLAFMVGQIDGSSFTRLQIDGYFTDLDTITTNNFMYSVATPRFVP